MKKPKTPSTPITPPSIPLSFAAAYTRFLPAAELLPSERVQPYRDDRTLVLTNVQIGVAAVTPYLARLRVETPTLPVDGFAELEDLVHALYFATEQAASSAAKIKRELLDPTLTRLHALREPMLLCAEMFALLGTLPKQRVERIRSGSGPQDAARDGVDLSDLFAEFAEKVKDKHPFTPEHFTEIRELAQVVLREVTPERARVKPSPQMNKAIENRDRLFSLLTERYEDVRRAGFYLFGPEADEKVPALNARRGRSRTEAGATEPLPGTPTADPTPAAPLS